MTVHEIKQAVDEGKTVCWGNTGYRVIKDKIGQYLIMFLQNQYCIGLTWKDGVTLNGEEDQFFILNNNNNEEV